MPEWFSVAVILLTILAGFVANYVTSIKKIDKIKEKVDLLDNIQDYMRTMRDCNIELIRNIDRILSNVQAVDGNQKQLQLTTDSLKETLANIMRTLDNITTSLDHLLLIVTKHRR